MVTERKQWQCDNVKNLVSKADLKPIMKRDNHHGILHFLGHILAITVTASLLISTWGTAWVISVFVVHGVLLAFLFAPMHECIHSSAFKSRQLNNIIGHISGLIILRPFLYSKYRHMAHHTWTQHPNMDPDQVFFPKTFGEYIAHISSFNIWHRLIKNLVFLAAGKISREEREFLPTNETPKVVNEARLMLLAYTLVAVLSVISQSWLAIYLWLAPRVLGEIALRAFRMVEHTGMEVSPNMLANTRTTETNALVRALYWNMPYHAEHHLYPNVPFHALPALHRYVRPHLKEVGPGVIRVHLHIIRQIWRQRAQKTA